VCHTQANLILAVGLTNGRFFNDENHLILFKDFLISSDLHKQVELIFNKVLCLDGNFPLINTTWFSKIKRYPICIEKINQFMINPFDKVFEVNDEELLNIYVVKKACKLNPSTELIWLEDGSHPYFINGFQNSGFNSNKIFRLIRKSIFKYFFRLGKFYDFEGGFMGSSKHIKTVYLTFPGKERSVYSHKIKEAITDEEYRLGISYLFKNTQHEVKKNSIILVLDKLDSYKNFDLIKHLIKDIKDCCNENKIQLYYKLHPKEELRLNELGNTDELNKNLAIEYYYSSNHNANCTIIGVKSTGLQASKKLGFKTISTMKLVGEDETNLSKFYTEIDVIIPISYEFLHREMLN
jgi:hypothetical protein